MPLLKRKPRPFLRRKGSLRDDRLFIVASDDTYAPKQYFSFFEIPRIQVHVIPTEDGTSSAAHVLDRLLAVDHEDDDELWMLLDTDHYTQSSHIKSFTSALKTAKEKGVKVALSKPCFEFWLLLHLADVDNIGALKDARQTCEQLSESLDGYNKTKLKSEHYPESSVVEACGRARELDRSDSAGRLPDYNTSRAYLLWEAILTSALASQLHPQFREFRERLLG